MRHTGRPARARAILLVLFVCFCLFRLPSAHAAQQIVVAVKLNQQPKGDFFVILEDDGDFLVRAADLTAMGLTRIPGEPRQVDGESYLSLLSTPELDFHFDENSLTLEITADPGLLGQASLDFAPVLRQDVYYPRDNSLFLNYGAFYDDSWNDGRSGTFSLNNELGIRISGYLFLTDSSFTADSDDSKFLRLNTRVIYDSRPTLRRITAGDNFATSGPLGSLVNLGGFSVSKIYDINPYFIEYPMFNYTGQLPLPSEVDVYLGGTKLRSKKLPPGSFDLENLYGISGDQAVEIVVRDAFGREQRVRRPFYFTDRMLGRGLQEYSYNVGLVREDFGQKSNSYSALAASAFHRFGLTDFFNLGWRGEGKHDLANLGLESVLKVSHFGLLRFDASASRHDGAGGRAGLLSYEYLNRRVRLLLGAESYSHAYRTLADTTADDPRIRKLRLRAGAGYTNPLTGSLAFDYYRTEFYNEDTRETFRLSWSKRVLKHCYLNLAYSHIREDATINQFFVGLNYYFARDHSLAASYRHDEGNDIQTVELRKNTPIGEGIGWELSAEHSESDLSNDYLVSGDFQYNAPHAIFRGTASHGHQTSVTDEKLRLGLSGAIVHLGGTTALSRPVNDSFALVSVGDAKDVAVSANGQYMGRTNDHGKIVVPVMSSYYENRVSFNDKDIPIEYLMPQVKLTVSPPLRSGSCLSFPLKKYQAFTGFILIQGPQGKRPLSYAAMQLKTPDGSFPFWTGADGEFYLDSQQVPFDMLAYQGCEGAKEITLTPIRAGTYPVVVQLEGLSFETELTIPESEDIYVDMGQLVWPAPPGLFDNPKTQK